MEKDPFDDRAIHIAESEEAIELGPGTNAIIENVPTGAVGGKGVHGEGDMGERESKPKWECKWRDKERGRARGRDGEFESGV